MGWRSADNVLPVVKLQHRTGRDHGHELPGANFLGFEGRRVADVRANPAWRAVPHGARDHGHEFFGCKF